MKPLKYTITFGNGETFEGELGECTNLTVSLGVKWPENELFPLVVEKRETRKEPNQTVTEDGYEHR
jgi:hypothetical protein